MSTIERAPVPYDLVEHAADIGFEVVAPSLEALFARAALALHDVIADTARARPELERALAVEGYDLGDALVRWLEEALFAFEVERLLFAEVAVERAEWDPAAGGRAAVRGAARGERFDPLRHELRRPIKAVTYHDLFVGPAGAGPGVRARVILDL